MLLVKQSSQLEASVSRFTLILLEYYIKSGRLSLKSNPEPIRQYTALR